MTSALSLVALAIAAATTTCVLIIHELHIRALNTRVSNAVMGVPGQSAPLQDMTGWLSSLGMRYRRFYSPENLEQLRAIVQSSGLNPHRTMPILIGGPSSAFAADISPNTAAAAAQPITVLRFMFPPWVDVVLGWLRPTHP